ncbi:MAG: nitroreductase family protein [Streptococcaceae bacterium]|jgi:nitroreductase|nr:nitroreductase family protein [Streptococcaceae bacterium]
MEFKELNHNRHAVKRFKNETVSIDTIRAILNEAHYAPSGINMQNWHFVIVESAEKKAALAATGRGHNGEQISNAPAVVVIFSDTNLHDRFEKVLQDGGIENETQEKWVGRIKNQYLEEVENYTPQYKSDYLAMNTGFVTMNLMYAIKDAGYEGNVILGFNKGPHINEILKVDARFRPELVIVFGKSDEKGEPHYRFPLSEITEVR